VLDTCTHSQQLAVRHLESEYSTTSTNTQANLSDMKYMLCLSFVDQRRLPLLCIQYRSPRLARTFKPRTINFQFHQLPHSHLREMLPVTPRRAAVRKMVIRTSSYRPSWDLVAYRWIGPWIMQTSMGFLVPQRIPKRPYHQYQHQRNQQEVVQYGGARDRGF
jgi:hypothetical protein